MALRQKTKGEKNSDKLLFSNGDRARLRSVQEGEPQEVNLPGRADGVPRQQDLREAFSPVKSFQKDLLKGPSKGIRAYVLTGG